MAELATRLAGLSPEKRELLEALLRKKKVEAASASAIPPRGDAPGPFPLSFSQERLWLLHQLEPESPAYNIPVALRLAGDLDVRALRGSFAALVRRHEALRARFVTRDGNPMQEVDPPRVPPLPLVDLGGLPAGRRETEARGQAEAEALRPFDLHQGPLCRCVLFRLSGVDHLLLATLHHIVSDGWSTGVFARELGAFYSAARSGRPAALPPLPVQYVDFALWQRKELDGPALEKHLAFWRERLAGLDPVLELPSDRPRPARRTPRGASLPLALPETLSRDLKELAVRQGTTLFTTLLGAFFALLHRQTYKEALCAGTPVASRRQVETEGLIGFFVNTLVVRADLAGDTPFRGHLARVHEAVLDSQAHEALPFEKLVSELAPERSLSHNPIFQVAFTFQNAPGRPLELPGVDVRGVELPLRTAKFDLTLVLGEEGRIAGGIDYSLDLFDAPTIARTAGQLQSLLAAVAADPSLPLSAIPLLSPAERHQLLVEWGGSGGEPDPGETLHGRFEARARRSPEAPAVLLEGMSLGYGELNRRANRLARRLRRLGVGPDSRVGLCLERSPELAVGILGILKAGGAYVPLDPSYPRERLVYMIEDAGVEVVVGTEASVAGLPAVAGTVLLDAHRDLLEALPTDDPAPLADGASLAYVIYTSGSTGRPKGVLVSHGNVARLFDATRAWFDFNERDVWTLFHSYAFDFSVWELWGALLHGGSVVVVPREVTRSPERFLDLLVRDRVTVLNQTPSAFSQLARVDGERGGVATGLRLVVFGGEALDPVSLAPWFARHGDEKPLLVNMYGITETTVHVTYRPLRAADAGSRRSVLGVPIPDLSLYVLDPWLRPAPVGVPGELAVGGAGLARGYLGRPDLTASRFVPDPAGGRPGARLYRSGDLGRFLPDGGVEYLGRIDHQVKIRGFRIELGEIESVLASHPAVRECVVLAREGVAASRLLVAYLTGDPVPGPGELRAFLAGRLPEYMVPALFVPLETLPLTPNGKVDRRALSTSAAPVASVASAASAAPARGGSASGEEYLAPSGPDEELIAAVWAEVLGLERVDARDDFFALGGHSLLATQVASRIRSVLGVELPLRRLFESRTLAELARAVREARRDEALEAPPIVPVPRGGELPLSFAQQRLWLLDQLEPGTPAYNIPLAVRVAGELPVDVLERVFAEVARRHEALRTVFASVHGRPVQVIAEEMRPRIPVLDLSGLPEREERTRGLALEEAWRPFDLERGPLLRLSLVRLGERDHLLLMTMHHIVSDGWSMGVLLREIAALWSGAALPALPVQYADFAVWQRRWLQGEALEARLSYWRRRLAGAPRLLELPLDRPRPALQTYRGTSRPVSLPPRLSEAVHGLCRREGATPFMVLLAAWAVLLGRHAGQEDVLLGTPIAGRNRQEIEGLIGFFVNTLVLRADLSGRPRFAELLGRVRQTALDAYTHQDVPFERLVEELVPERDLAHSPLFQAMLAFQNTPAAPGLSLPGLTLTPLDADSGVAQFDLTLTLAERRDQVFQGALEYNTHLFDGSTAARLWSRFTALLEAAAGDPSLPLPDLPLLPAPERHQALVEWNDTARAYEAGNCLHDLVSRQAASTPDAVALSFEGRELSYGELERRANRLARHLIGLGVAPEDRVGLRLERSLEMVVGVLGVLKTGAAYVPLDPRDPAGRLAMLTESSGARVVLTGGEAAGAWPDAPPAVRAGADNLAYVLFTSGSTGRPKGVMVPHRGVVNRLLWGQEVYRLGPRDAVLQKAPLSFDISVWEIFAPLIAGARLVLAGPGGHRDPAYLARAAAAHGVTLVDFVPSMLAAFLEEPGLERCASLRQVFTGGEALSPALRDRFLERLPGVRLDNQYGPTEVSIDTAYWVCRPGPVAIGRPIGNARLYVVDRGLRLQPPGVAGELLVGGTGLTRGYLGRPDLTASAFVPDPFGPAVGGRLYRTGDLVRPLADGDLEFLGRIDHQVKVRGFRIELGEVEAVLESHPGVRECVAVVREDVPGVRLLVAYATGGVSPEDLRAFVAGRLPEYMVPAVFVPLEALPLSPNGKVDRRALPAPERQREETRGTGNLIEELLAGIWAEVLGLDRVGVDEDFFALGGHSLLATQVVSRVRAVLGVELPLRRLFEAPTVAELARVVRESREERPAPPVVPVPRDGELPLSFAQQRLWLLDQLEPGSPAYNIPLAVRLGGELSPDRLERVFVEIVRRHEALRTTFASREGRPVQEIAAPRVELPLVDLSGLPEREARARQLALEEAGRPFELARGPLLRLTLLRLGERDHVLLMTMHHIVSDGWSTGVLLREVGTLWNGEVLPELPVQYADFAVWQRQWLQGEVLDGQLAYWKDQLGGAPRVLEMPADRPRPVVQTFRGSAVPVSLPAGKVRELCRREGVTPFMALLAAWSVLLGRHAGQPEVLVGTPVAGRNRREIEGLIGFFVNALVLRADLSAPSFGELLGRVRRTALDAFTHQDLPFDRLVEELAPERDLSISPLFQAVFTLGNASRESLELPGLTLSPLDVDSGTTKFDLTMGLQESAGGFTGGLEYNADLFDRSTAARLAARFAALLEGAVEEPGLALPDLPLLLPSERQQALLEWNDARSEYPRESSVHGLFEAVARSLPEAPAIVAGGEVWSYRRLDEAADGLAHRLRSLAVGRESVVGVGMERSAELIVGILAVLKAGGAYLPLDAEYPDERLAFMLADTGAPAVLVHERTRQRFEGKARLLSVDGDGGEPLEVEVPAEGLALVIYTSGSTGRPKGVALAHRGIVRLVRETNYLRIGPGGRMGHAANIGFDAATLEIWGALLNGAALVVIPREVALSPAELGAQLRRDGVTSLFLTTALFNQVAREAPEALSGLRTVMFGGEAADPGAVARAAGGPERLVHLYGPAENTTLATWYRVTEVPPGSVTVPIGLPVATSSVYVLDRWQGLVPPGAVGELCVGGDGLARGYLNRPDLTAERFIPHPWGTGERLYHTGDLVRQRVDGAIEFVGRVDDQVKIRGFRIEPGEVEAVLLTHPAVREATVLAREHRLVAWVAADLEAPALRAWLRERLPDYMVPSAFVILEALPLTPNGKVDRRALPAPERVRPVEEESPKDPIEELLAGLWAEVLGLDRVGVEEDFFALGGHSLLATQVISRVRAVLGIELPLRALFESPTVSGLARTVRESQGGRQAPPIVPVPRDGELPLSFSQQRLWFLDQLEPGSPAYNIPLAVRLTGDLPVALLERIFAEVVRRHEALRTIFVSRDGRPAQIVTELSPELRVVDLSALPERETRVRGLAREEALRPFDLQRGPLLRLALVRLDARDHVLLVTMHHIVSDGWSLGVLLREIAALWEGGTLPELPVQYADFAHWQRQWLRGEVLEDQVSYWRRQLAGAPRVLELPLDRPRPAAQTFRGASRAVTLSIPLHELCRREGVTPFMVLLAAWAALLGRHAGQEDILVGTPVAGRNRREIEDLIGFFVNTLVLRVDLAGSPGFAEVLRRVRKTALDGYTHQDVPFERLVEELVPERDMARSPLFQVMLVLQNASGGDLSVPGLSLAPLAMDGALAKFDLTLALQERGGQGFEGALEFNTDLFDGSTAARLLARFQTLLEAAVADPGLPVDELPLLLPGERHQALFEWNDTASVFPGGCLHELVSAQARRTPDAVAASFEGQALSYAGLERRVNRLARHLIGVGVEPDGRVGVRMERSLEMIVALLGVLKAGASYVPLDPTYPAERLALLVESSGARVVLDRELPDGELPDTAPEIPAGEGNLAYVIYTSGSTGTPKGVMVPHRGIVNRLLWMQEAYPLAPGDRVLQKTPFSFDVSLGELFGPLLCGAQVVFARPEGHKDPACLAELIAREGITALHFVPSMMQAFLEVEEADLSSVRRVLASGEALPPELARRFFGRFTGVELLNLYGPTEASVEVSVWACEPESPTVPIGRPISNLRLYVVDRELRSQPIGVPGELLLGGVGLARGYLGRPDLTATAFVPDPFGDGGRLYRTGDLCRLLPDGNVEFLGRIDHQVKIRGFRVELGEVEAALLLHPEVRECAILVRNDTLVAYWVGTAEAGALRVFLSERLPGYMVPSTFVALDALPLTSSGKVDRAALPVPELTGERERLGPRDVLELRLVRLWEELLGLQPIGVRDDFFELGGHSLLAVQLVARIQKSFGRTLPLATLLRNPTVERLAAVLREGGEPARGVLVELAPGTGRPFFLVHAVGGEVLSYVPLARHLERPVYGFQAHEGSWTLEEMAARYVRALREVQPEGPYLLGGWSMGGVVAFEMARQLERQGGAVDAVVLIDSPAPGEAGVAADDELPALFAQDVARLSGSSLSHPLPDFGQLAPEAERRFAVFRSNSRALEGYAGGPCAAPVVLFKAAETVRPDPDLGWGRFLERPIETHELPGDHYTLLRQPHAQALAARLRERLEALR